MEKIFLVMLLLIALVSMLIAEKWIYEMETITIPVGEGEDELYVYDSPDHFEDAPDYGPTRFTLDNLGNIYVLARGAQRREIIKKFHQDGHYICSSSFNKNIWIDFIGCYKDNVYSFCHDGQNNMFIQRYGLDCKLIDTHKTDEFQYSFIENNEEEIGFYSGDNKFKKIRFSEDRVVIENKNLLENIEFNYNRKKGELIISFLKLNKEINLMKLWPNKIGHTFLNFDNNNCLYIQIHSYPLQDSKLGIITNEGKSIDTNLIFEHYTKYGFNFAEGIPIIVTHNGLIFQLLPKKESIEIRKWHKVGEEK